jgi:hypothetical protein
MHSRIKREARLKLAISTTIIDNRAAVFAALLHTDRSRLDVKLAEFLLHEAAWPVEEFMTDYVMGELDG